MTSINIKIPDDMHQSLKKIKYETGATYTGQVLKAVRDYLETKNTENTTNV